MPLCDTVLYNTILYCTILHYTTLCCTVLYYTKLNLLIYFTYYTYLRDTYHMLVRTQMPKYTNTHKFKYTQMQIHTNTHK